MDNDKIDSNEEKLKVGDPRSPILYVFSFQVIQAIKDVLVEINLVGTPSPTLLNTLHSSQRLPHSGISFSPVCLLSIPPFRTQNP